MPQLPPNMTVVECLTLLLTELVAQTAQNTQMIALLTRIANAVEKGKP